MKYLLALVFTLIFSSGFSQHIQWTIKQGAQANEVDVYLRPTFDFNPTATFGVYFGQVQFAIAWQASCPTIGQPTVGFTIDPAFNTFGGGTYTTAVFPMSSSIDPIGENYNVISMNRIGSGAQTVAAGVEVKVGTVNFTNSDVACTIKIVDYADQGNDGQANCYATNSALGTFQQAPTSNGNFYSSPGNSVAGGNAVSGFASIIVPVSLPVKLTSFTAVANNCNASLVWKTTEEVNLSHYDIEESTNGTTFTKLTTITATGGAAENRYSYNAGAVNGNRYYRLKMTDKDGKFTYSNIALVRINCGSKGFSALVYPNPASKGTGVNVNLQGFNGTINGRLFNAEGKLIANQVFVNGSNNIATNNLAIGMYQLVIMDATGNNETKKIMITK